METSSQIYTEFLPISRADMEARGWDQPVSYTHLTLPTKA